jgi:transposase
LGSAGRDHDADAVRSRGNARTRAPGMEHQTHSSRVRCRPENRTAIRPSGLLDGLQAARARFGSLRILGINEQRNRPCLGHIRRHNPLPRQADPIQRGGRPNPAGASGRFRCSCDRPLAQLQANGPINLAELHAWLVAEHGYRGSLRSVQRYWARTHPAPWVRARRRDADPLWRELSEKPIPREFRPNGGQACNQLRRYVAARLSPWLWMHEVMQGLLPTDSISLGDRDPDEISELLRRIKECGLADRNKALAVIASRQGISPCIICRFLGLDRKSLRRYLRLFAEGGTAALFSRQVDPSRALTNASTKQAVFALLHEPPANHGINRTTWKMADLVRVLRSRGYSVCPQNIRRITKAAGYRWRKARTVLTSNDPDYAQSWHTYVPSYLNFLLTRLSFPSTNSVRLRSR